MTDIAVLNHAEQVALEECERVIEGGLKGFKETGSALTFVRDNRLYRETHPTFEAYVRERWNLTPQHANRLALAAGVVAEMEPIGSIEPPTNEAQARELAKVPEPERAEVWRETVERTEGKPTAAAVRETYERTQAPGPVDKAPPVDPGVTPAPAVESAALPQEPVRPAIAPPAGSPATWTPEQHEQHRLEIQRVQIIERAQRRAPRLVAEIRDLITEVMAGMNLGETDLITPKTIADIRLLVDILEARMEATQ